MPLQVMQDSSLFVFERPHPRHFLQTSNGSLTVTIPVPLQIEQVSVAPDFPRPVPWQKAQGSTGEKVGTISRWPPHTGHWLPVRGLLPRPRQKPQGKVVPSRTSPVEAVLARSNNFRDDSVSCVFVMLLLDIKNLLDHFQDTDSCRERREHGRNRPRSRRHRSTCSRKATENCSITQSMFSSALTRLSAR